VSFNPRIWRYALEHWPSAASILRLQGKTGPCYYPPHIYEQLGII
jgi:hypothetical protein